MTSTNLQIELVFNNGEIEHLEEGFWIISMSAEDRNVILEEGPFPDKAKAIKFAHDENYSLIDLTK